MAMIATTTSSSINVKAPRRYLSIITFPSIRGLSVTHAAPGNPVTDGHALRIPTGALDSPPSPIWPGFPI